MIVFTIDCTVEKLKWCCKLFETDYMKKLPVWI